MSTEDPPPLQLPPEPAPPSTPKALQAELARVLEARKRRSSGGWVSISGGLTLVVAGVALSIWSHRLLHGGGTYLMAYGPMLVGFGLIIRGMLRLTADVGGVIGEPGKHHDVPLAVGFKSYIAWRYLMARDHKVRRLMLWLVIVALFLVCACLIAQRVIFVPHGAFNFDVETLDDGAKYVGWVEIGGFVLLGLLLLVASIRYVFTFFTTVPLVGVWIGTGALVCVLSVMSGFEADLRTKILGSNAHVQITMPDGDFTEWRKVKAQVDKIPGVVASTPYAVSEVVIAAYNNGSNVIIKGIDPATVGSVTQLVHDLDDKDAMTRLAPLIEDVHDLSVPQTAKPSPGEVDPAPADMPVRGDPIDYSQPAPEPDAGVGSGSASGSGSVSGPGSGSGSGSVSGAGSGSVSGSGSALGPGSDPDPDHAPLHAVGREAAGSGSGAAIGSGSDTFAAATDNIRAVDVDQPTMRRTMALPGILVGRELARQIHLSVGQEVRVVSPLSDPSNPDATGTPIPFNRDYRVAGVFFTGMYEYDLKYVYVTLDSLTEFLDRGDTVDGIEVRVANPDDSDAYVSKISALLGPRYTVQDWKELNRSLFSALKLEKIAMFLVLAIVILVASFSIVGNLIMVVVEKQREIALLKTLGASDASIMQVFAVQGTLIGLLGTGLGVTTGLLACTLAKHFGIPLNPEVYYIDRMPVNVDWGSVIVTGAAGILISMAATFYPALMAARVRPAAGLRH